MHAERTCDPPREIDIPRLAFSVALLAIPAWLWNRALLPALPGSRAGLESTFDRLSLVGNILSQLLAITLAWLIIKLVVSSLGTFVGTATGRPSGRLVSLPVGSAVGFLLVASTVGPLDPEMHLLLSSLGTAALAAGVAPSLRNPNSRAAGLLLLVTVLGCLGYTLAGLLALKASVESLPREYALSRLLSTAGQLFDFITLLWVGSWLVLSPTVPTGVPHPSDGSIGEAARREPGSKHLSTRGMALLPVAFAVAIAFVGAWLSTRGRTSSASFAEVVLGRAFSSLGREPSPLGPVTIGPTLDLVAVLFSAILLLMPKTGSRITRVAMALVLLGRCSPDVPTHAALLTAGALLLIWHAPDFRRLSARDPGSSTQAPLPLTDRNVQTAETTSAP